MEGTRRIQSQLPQIRQRVLEIPRILNLYPQIVFMPLILLCEVPRMLEVSRLSAHPNSRVQIKW